MVDHPAAVLVHHLLDHVLEEAQDRVRRDVDRLDVLGRFDHGRRRGVELQDGRVGPLGSRSRRAPSAMRATRRRSPARCRRSRARGSPRRGTRRPGSARRPGSGRSRTTRARAHARDQVPHQDERDPRPDDAEHERRPANDGHANVEPGMLAIPNGSGPDRGEPEHAGHHGKRSVPLCQRRDDVDRRRRSRRRRGAPAARRSPRSSPRRTTAGRSPRCRRTRPPRPSACVRARAPGAA